MPNIWMLTLFIHFEYGFVTFILSKWLSKNLKKPLVSSILIFYLSYILLISQGLDIRELYFFYSTLEHFLLLTISAYTLYYLTDGKDNFSFYNDSRFWISAGVLIYFSGNLLLYEIGYFKPVNDIWLIHAGLNIIANIFYTGGFLSQNRLRTIGFWVSVPRLSLSLLLLLLPVSYVIIAD